MLWNETEGRWNEFVCEVMTRLVRSTDNDVVECRGNRDILIGKLQQLYGMSVDEAGQQNGELERRVNQAKQALTTLRRRQAVGSIDD